MQDWLNKSKQRIRKFSKNYHLKTWQIMPVAIRIWQMERNLVDVINSVDFELIRRIVLGEPDWIRWKSFKVACALPGVRGAAGWLYEASSGIGWAHMAKSCEWPWHRLSARAPLTQSHVKCWCPVWWYLEVGPLDDHSSWGWSPQKSK